MSEYQTSTHDKQRLKNSILDEHVQFTVVVKQAEQIELKQQQVESYQQRLF
jgi:hypothetical protein